jgi:hypothetical protein
VSYVGDVLHDVLQIIESKRTKTREFDGRK